MTKADLFLQLAQPDENGYSRWVEVSEFTGDLTKVNNIDDKLFDIIITSNVFQHISCFIGDNDPYDKLKEIFELLKSHLSEEGLLQLLYHYSFTQESLSQTYNDPVATRNIRKVYDALQTRNLFVQTFDGVTDRQDAVLIYQKTRK